MRLAGQTGPNRPSLKPGSAHDGDRFKVASLPRGVRDIGFDTMEHVTSADASRESRGWCVFARTSGGGSSETPILAGVLQVAIRTGRAL
jgi:hypothetical protein